MTSVCTNLGALQLVLASWAERQQPSWIANAVAVGVAFSALLTLFVAAGPDVVLARNRQSLQCLSRAVAYLRCGRDADSSLASQPAGRA
jgi:hypothetical protein